MRGVDAVCGPRVGVVRGMTEREMAREGLWSLQYAKRSTRFSSTRRSMFWRCWMAHVTWKGFVQLGSYMHDEALSQL